MPIDILMPALSPTMEEGTISKWFVKEGDQVKSGDILAEIETDKAIMEFETVDDGTIDQIIKPEGLEPIKVNEKIASLITADESPKQENLEKKPLTISKEEINSSQTNIQGESATTQNKLNLKEKEKEKETITVREALRDAMAEEMRTNSNVFLMGEEVAEYEGAYKISQGLLEEFSAKRVIDTPITEHGFAGIGIGAAFGGLV
ncbi:MAG: biotin/lipoyl-containing protein, partial [Paracoccaceae bacterium]